MAAVVEVHWEEAVRAPSPTTPFLLLAAESEFLERTFDVMKRTPRQTRPLRQLLGLRKTTRPEDVLLKKTLVHFAAFSRMRLFRQPFTAAILCGNVKLQRCCT